MLLLGLVNQLCLLNHPLSTMTNHYWQLIINIDGNIIYNTIILENVGPNLLNNFIFSLINDKLSSYH
jgi:hypothetical protein